MSAILVALFACVALSSAQVVTLGGCPKSVKPMNNFDAAAFLKTWYMQKSYFFIFEFGGRCSSATYTLNEDGSIKVLNKQKNSITKKEQTVEGTATFNKNNTIAELTVEFPSNILSAKAPYWVVDTDYTSYALVWVCYDGKVVHSSNAYLMTRERNPSEETVNKGLAAAKAAGISTKLFLDNDQDNCE